jgi:hypothetical protein
MPLAQSLPLWIGSYERFDSVNFAFPHAFSSSPTSVAPSGVPSPVL